MARAREHPAPRGDAVHPLRVPHPHRTMTGAPSTPACIVLGPANSGEWPHADTQSGVPPLGVPNEQQERAQRRESHPPAAGGSEAQKSPASPVGGGRATRVEGRRTARDGSSVELPSAARPGSGGCRWCRTGNSRRSLRSNHSRGLHTWCNNHNSRNLTRDHAPFWGDISSRRRPGFSPFDPSGLASLEAGRNGGERPGGPPEVFRPPTSGGHEATLGALVRLRRGDLHFAALVLVAR